MLFPGILAVVVVVVTRSDQPKPPAVAIVRQNCLSSASCRASVAVTPESWQIWWIQVVGGRPLARFHSCEGRSPSLVLVQIRRTGENFFCHSVVSRYPIRLFYVSFSVRHHALRSQLSLRSTWAAAGYCTVYSIQNFACVRLCTNGWIVVLMIM